MQVDFNNLRVQTCKQISELIDFLNDKTATNGNVDFNIYDIDQTINELRNNIVTMACCFNEGDEDFKDLSDKINVSYLLPDQYE